PTFIVFPRSDRDRRAEQLGSALRAGLRAVDGFVAAGAASGSADRRPGLSSPGKQAAGTVVGSGGQATGAASSPGGQTPGPASSPGGQPPGPASSPGGQTPGPVSSSGKQAAGTVVGSGGQAAGAVSGSRLDRLPGLSAVS